MNKDRRKASRRHGDEFFAETLATLQDIDRIARGQELDYTDNYVNMVGLKGLIGRRENDQRLGDLLCSTIESIASSIDVLRRRDQVLRQVKITKVSGKRGANVRSYTSIEGWEAEGPQVGKSYRIYTYDARVFRSSPIVHVRAHYFQTQNSLYHIEKLQ